MSDTAIIEILKKVNGLQNLSGENVIEKIKNELEINNILETYEDWKRFEFDVNYSFDAGNTLLHYAAKGGCENVKVVDALIEKGANVKAKDKSGTTPLHMASILTNVEIAELLIQHGADINAKDKSGTTPLHMASILTNVEIAELLIQHGADINAKDKSGTTPLHMASILTNVEIAELLIQHGADINAVDSKGRTPLIISFCSRSLHDEKIKTVQLLLKKSVNLDVKDDLEHNALYYAISLVRRSRYPYRLAGTLQVEIVRDIVSRMKLENLDIKIREYYEFPGFYRDFTPLEFALRPDFGFVSSQQLEVAEILLNAGANPNFVDKELTNSLLTNEKTYQVDFLMLLLAKGLKLDKEMKEVLSKNGMLKFFIRSRIEFDGFFQNIKNDTELVDGLIEIRKCIQHKAQELAFKAWLRYGVDEITRKDTLEHFLMQKTGRTLITIVDKLRSYLSADDVRNLFLAGLKLEESFVEKHEEEISKLLTISMESSLNLDEYVYEKFIKKRNERRENRESKEEILYDTFSLYEESESKKLLALSLDISQRLGKENSEELLKEQEELFKKPKEREKKAERKKLLTITTSAGLLLGSSIAYLAGAATLTSVVAVIAVFLATAAVGALIGYGVGKLCEKVSEEKQKDPEMSTLTAVKSVLFDVSTAECSKELQV